MILEKNYDISLCRFPEEEKEKIGLFALTAVIQEEFSFIEILSKQGQ